MNSEALTLQAVKETVKDLNERPIVYQKEQSPEHKALIAIQDLADKYDGGQLRTTPLMCTIRQPSAVHVVQCEHRWDAQKQPRHNCGFCWYVYFQIHPAEVVAGESTMRVYGDKVIEKSKGLKYLKALKQAVKRKQWEEKQEQLANQTVTVEVPTTPEETSTTCLPDSQIIPSSPSTTPEA